jgi:hypothetical protein
LSPDWPERASRWLRSIDLLTIVEPQRVFAYAERGQEGRHSFADGVQVQRIWIAPGRSGLVFLPRRVYFVGSLPDRRPERVILDDDKRPPSDKAGGIALIINALVAVMRADSGLTELPLVELDAGTGLPIVTQGIAAESGGGLNALYRLRGFDHVPDPWSVSVVPLDGVTVARASEFERRIAEAARRRHAFARCKLVDVAAIRSRLAALVSTGTAPRPGSILLILLPSHHSPASRESLELLSSLEAARIPFRRAYADDPLDFSIPDQLPSLLMAAGGRPHAIRASHSLPEALTIGIDLSHPLDGKGSRVAATIVDESGMLIWASRINVPRNETIAPETIQRIGTLIRTFLLDIDQRRSPIILLRDGRIPERELVAAWQTTIGANLAVIEIRKRGNPVLFRDKALDLSPPYAVQIAGSNTVLAAAIEPHDSGAFTEPLKLTWLSENNHLGLTATEISRHILAHCHAPGLGLHPHRLPSAIYWADGIAGADDEDLRFRGIPLA